MTPCSQVPSTGKPPGSGLTHPCSDLHDIVLDTSNPPFILLWGPSCLCRAACHCICSRFISYKVKCSPMPQQFCLCLPRKVLLVPPTPNTGQIQSRKLVLWVRPNQGLGVGGWEGEGTGRRLGTKALSVTVWLQILPPSLVRNTLEQALLRCRVTISLHRLLGDTGYINMHQGHGTASMPGKLQVKVGIWGLAQ